MSTLLCWRCFASTGVADRCFAFAELCFESSMLGPTGACCTAGCFYLQPLLPNHLRIAGCARVDFLTVGCIWTELTADLWPWAVLIVWMCVQGLRFVHLFNHPLWLIWHIYESLICYSSRHHVTVSFFLGILVILCSFWFILFVTWLHVFFKWYSFISFRLLYLLQFILILLIQSGGSGFLLPCIISFLN